MTDTANSGMRRPDNNATIGSGAATFRQHANSVQTGSFILSVALVQANFQVVFPTPFAVEPIILCTVLDPNGHLSGVRGDKWGPANNTDTGYGSLTGFWFASIRASGSARTLRCNWQAIGVGTEVGG